MGIMTWKLKRYHITIHGNMEGGTMNVLYPIMHTANNAFVDVRGWFASDHFYPLYRYDCLTKIRVED